MDAEFLQRRERLFGDGAIRIIRQSTPIAACRLDDIPLRGERVSEVDMRHRQSRVKRHGASRIGDREVVLALQIMRVGTIGQSDRVLCSQLDGAGVALDCSIEVALLLIRGAEIAESGRELRLDGGGVFQRVNRAVEVPLPDEVDTSVHVRFCRARRQLAHFPEVCIGTIGVSQFGVRDAAHVVEVGRSR